MVRLISNIDYCTKHLVKLLLTNTSHFYYLDNIGFNTANFAHDYVPQSLEVTALQWLCHKAGHHFLCGAPLNANLLNVDPIRNEEVPDVDMPHPFTI